MATRLDSGQQDVTDTATALIPNRSEANTDFQGGFRLKNLIGSAAPIYYGRAGVTPQTGDELGVGESQGFASHNIAAVFVVSAAASGSRVSWSGE